MFAMHRIFCATPWELEAERGHFYEIVGKFNETVAMPANILFVPVSLTNIRDKRPVQFVVDENIRDCRFYLLVLYEDWGPPERNFRNDYHLALQCAVDPALPMRSVAVLAKKQLCGAALAEGLPEPAAFFSTAAEFEARVNDLLTSWLASIGK